MRRTRRPWSRARRVASARAVVVWPPTTCSTVPGSSVETEPARTISSAASCHRDQRRGAGGVSEEHELPPDHDGVERVEPGPVRADENPGADDHGAQPPLPHRGEHVPLGEQLGARVGSARFGSRLERRLLGDERIIERAPVEDGERAHVDQPRDPVPQDALDHVLRARDRAARVLRPWPAHRGAGVIDHPHARHGGVDCGRVPEVAEDDVHPGMAQRPVRRRPAAEGTHALSARHEPLHELAAEPAGRAGHQRVGAGREDGRARSRSRLAASASRAAASTQRTTRRPSSSDAGSGVPSASAT